MALVTDYEELDVYLLALELQQEIYELSKCFPNEERYSLTDQIRRCSRSISEQLMPEATRRVSCRTLRRDMISAKAFSIASCSFSIFSPMVLAVSSAGISLQHATEFLAPLGGSWTDF